MGRSYGDAAQLNDGFVLATTRLDDFELDPDRGTITARAGATLKAILETIVPAGWTLPVLPGTQHVSVGGAIAGDIHGKSHVEDGTFGAHVEELELLTTSGELMKLAGGQPEFAATLGGMGLTGVIVSARIRLRRVTSALLSVDTDRVDDLEGALEALDAAGGRYRVAWLDLLGPRPVRGVVTRADHVDAGGRSASPTVSARATVPRWWPGGILRPSAVRAYNELRFRRTPRIRRGQLESLGQHMFPLDALVAWPRLYGPQGFLQYQLVLPRGAEHVLRTVIERFRSSGTPCYLAVLKDFGAANDAPLSFPIAGWTLALDIPRSAPGLDALLDRFDELVAEAGGRVYLSKDSRMRPDAVAAMYPRLREWREVRDRLDPERLWRSDLAVRTGLIG
jgi:decaprenylphospho-beta-D-ribofuranose 2-oxidase